MFTVIIPTFDRRRFLERAVRSVLRQTWANFTLIVVDDGSTDDTREYLATVSDRRVHVVARENSGVSDARNVGLSLVRSEWVCFLDSDDEVQDTWLARFAAACSRPRAGLVSCSVRRKLEPNGRTVFLTPRRLGGAFGRIRARFLPGAFVVRSDVIVSVGGYASGLIGSENTELGMRIASKLAQLRLTTAVVPEALVTMHFDVEVRRRGDPRFAQGARYIIAHHASLLRRDPHLHGNLWAIIGVDAARSRNHAQARDAFLAAVRADPTNPKHWARLVGSVHPLAAQRLWAERG